MHANATTHLTRLALVALAALPLAAHPPTVHAADDAKVKRGRYLVNITGCHDCHTPLKMGPTGPEPDMTRMLSGHPQGTALPDAPRLPPGPWVASISATNTAWSGPWGVSYTANLTPDKDTGLGAWTLKEFAATMRSGKHLGVGRPILPPMPIPAYKHLNDADMEAMFRYLRSIPAIQNRVPAPLPPPIAAR